jgi:D-glycero-D-manno-heptose 1,7-bisphosphate phosphatase
MRSAIILDRDGVLIEDVHLLTRSEEIRLLPRVPAALRALGCAGYALVVASNQSVVARGLATEAMVEAVHAELQRLLAEQGSPAVERFYFCPHHPNATLPAYRLNCDCRKPRSGMLLRAARELNLDLQTSFSVGDRITDVIAGARAGCRTVLVETKMHLEPALETVEPLDLTVKPDYVCADLMGAVEWILKIR